MTTANSLTGIRIAPLSEQHVLQMLAIQRVVCKQLPSPELFFPLSDAEMLEMVGPRAVCMGAWAGDELAGFFGVVYMGNTPDNIGHDLALSSQDIDAVAYFKSVNILPQYRGAGIQKMLFHALSVGINTQELHPVSWFCSTVSPLNTASLKSFLDCGFRIQGLKPKYLGSWRYLMSRKPVLRCSEPGNDQQPMNALFVNRNDYERQISLLKTGWSGVQVLQNQSSVSIWSSPSDIDIKYTRAQL